MLNFRDAFTEYDQLKMHLDDEDKTAFITNEGVCYYKVMSFRVKNARVIYQRIMIKVFAEQIGRNMKVCVDNILVKSKDL